MNKRIITIIIALAAVCGGASAQQKQSTATRPRMVDYGVVKATVIGTSNIRILYAFLFLIPRCISVGSKYELNSSAFVRSTYSGKIIS